MSENYYRHSGHFSLPGAGLGLLFGLAASVVLAPLYAYLVLYIPLAGYITFIMSVGFGGLVGLATGSGLRRGRVRNDKVSLVAAGVVGLIAFYLSWAVWVYALLQRNDVEAHLVGLILHPGVLWEVIEKINQTGAWNLSGFTPTGDVLWGLWGIEALLILVPAALAPMGMIADPFCERCNTWCSEATGVATVAAGNPEELKNRLEDKDFGFLEALGGVAAGAERWFRLDLHNCPTCGTMHILTVKTVKVSVNKKGERSEEATDVVRHLIIDSTQAHRIRQLASAGAPAAPA